MLNKSALLCLCYMASAGAHDFWIQPQQYWLQSKGTTSLTLEVGHGPYRQRSPIPPSRIKRFEALTPGGAQYDLSGSPTQINVEEPGTYVLVLETDNRAQSHLPAIRFNDYLQSEGLTPALEERKRSRRMAMDGSESYSRRAKALVHVGPADAAVPTGDSLAGRSVGARQVIQPLGLRLEIVPEVSPYTEPRPATLPVKVLFEGQPLPGATIKLTQLEHDDVPFETHLTDPAGRAVFSMPTRGSWLLNVVWTQVLPQSSETDFETVFSSLSFGFSAAGPGAGTL
jgi:uncharacterized GH25 family protein